MPGFCRDCRCDVATADSRCPACGSPKVLHHPELERLAVAHVDCDAFYATIEKRDDLDARRQAGDRGRPPTRGGAHRLLRGAHLRGALRDAHVRGQAAVSVGGRGAARHGEIRARRRARCAPSCVTSRRWSSRCRSTKPSWTSPAPSACTAPRPRSRWRGFADRVEREIGITVSIGLSCNKFLAKIASDLDKPRGFAVLGAGEAAAFLATQAGHPDFRASARPRRPDWAATASAPSATCSAPSAADLTRRYGTEGVRLARLARGIDDRPVRAERETKSISAETTFDQDIAEFRQLELRLWRLCEKVSARLKGSALAGATVTLKLKTADFRLRTRAQSFGQPTQLAAKIFACGRELLARETDGTRYRLIGIGVSALVPAAAGDFADLIDRRTADAELAVDRLRARFGDDAVVKGLVFDQSDEE